MENIKYGKRMEGRWTPIRAKAQNTRTNPNSWETHLVRKIWDIGLLRALGLRIMMMSVANYSRLLTLISVNLLTDTTVRVMSRHSTQSSTFRTFSSSTKLLPAGPFRVALSKFGFFTTAI